MMDAVTFIRHIKTTTPDAGDSAVIAFGGSYGGSLSAFLRLNYPDVFFGSVAYGSPMRWFGPVENDSSRHISIEYVSLNSFLPWSRYGLN